MKFHLFSEFHFEKWDYDNPLKIGIGGSETAHIETALRLAKRGHEVISYSPIKETTERQHENVTWKDSKEADFKEEGIWIISREPQVADKFEKDHPNQKLILVMQDVWYKRMTHERAEKFDYLLPLCTSHRNFIVSKFKDLEDKIIQSSNGIRTDLIEKIEKENIQRKPYKLMHASSPDRGLLALLKIFRKLKQKNPLFELHVFYGFNNIEKMTEDDEVPLGDERVTRKEIILEAQQPGVFLRGRMGQEDLYREWFSSGIWCHPSSVFPETSCITCMDAQACGAVPVTAPLWAIGDNVKYGYMVQGQPLVDSLVRSEYVDKVLELVERKDIDQLRVHMMKYARERFDWERIVDQLEAMGETK